MPTTTQYECMQDIAYDLFFIANVGSPHILWCAFAIPQSEVGQHAKEYVRGIQQNVLKLRKGTRKPNDTIIQFSKQQASRCRKCVELLETMSSCVLQHHL